MKYIILLTTLILLATSSEVNSCSLCSFVVSSLQKTSFLSTPFSRASIAQTCESMGPAKPMCENLLISNGQAILNLYNKLPAQAICKTIQKCSTQWVNEQMPEKKALEMFMYLSSKLKKPKSTQACDLCKFIVGEVEQYANATEDQFEHELLLTCKKLPSQFEQLCDTIVLLYGHQLLEYILKYETPPAVCEAMSLCAKPSEAVVVKKPVKKFKDNCFTCTFLVDTVERFVAENTTIEEIEETLERVCVVLPENLRPECLKFVDQNVPVVIDYLEKNYPPKEVCQLLGWCSTTKHTPVKKIKPVAKKPVKKFKDNCFTCTFLVDTVERFVAENTTIEEIEETLERVCVVLPENLRPECLKFVDQNVPLVIDYLEKNYPPKEVCQLLGWCSTQKKVVKDTGCSLCTFIAQTAEKYVADNSTIQEIEAALDQVCQILPGSLQSTCKQVVDQELPQIVKYLEAQYTPEQICQLLGLCKTKEIAPKKNVGDNCDTCQFVVGAAEELLAQNSTVEQVEATLKQICAIIPDGEYKDQCNAAADQLPEIVAMLEKEYPPELVCKMIGVCTQKVQKKVGDNCATCKLVVQTVEQMIPLNKTEEEIEADLHKLCQVLPGDFGKTCDQLVDQYVPQIIKYLNQEYTPEKICQMLGLCQSKKIVKKVVKKVGDNCPMCTYLVSYAESMLASNKTEEEIEAGLHKLCANVPIFKNTCDQLVDNYIPQVIQLLESKLSPKEICQKIGLCSSKKVVKKVVKKVKDTKCSLCTFVVETAEHFLEQNSTVEEIENALHQICNIISLPGNLKQECNQLIDQYVPQIIQLLESEYGPEQICALIGICTSQIKKEAKKVKDNCGTCKFFVATVEQLVLQNATVDRIESELHELCELLPSGFKAQCDQLVNEDVPQVIKYLESKLTPDEICQKLGMCSSQIKKKFKDNCSICKYFVGKVESLIDQQSTEAQIEKALDQICSVVPGTFQKQCYTFAKQVPQVIQMLEQKLSPEVVCNQIGLCSSVIKIA